MSSARRPADRRAARSPSAPGPEIAGRLGAWFDEVRRDLPWRRTRDPYAIWLSEVMLQQTRVATVVDYFPRFLAKYPTVRALADASIDDVLGAWSGLGYYRRARALHGAAREMVSRYGGELPRTTSELESIPGIGRYTAGAIASIAFGARAPLVDGNVARVFSRLFAIDEDLRRPAAMRAIWSIAEELVPEKEPGRHNEALMELGATVCLPREPRCGACPVETLCAARREGKTAELPRLSPKKEPREVRVAALVCHREGRVLAGRRIAEGLFGGLWEPPMVELAEPKKTDEPPTAKSERTIVSRLGASLGWPKLRAVRVASERRTLTHRRLLIEIYTPLAGEVPPDTLIPHLPYDALAWLTEEELGARGVSTASRKVLAAARQGSLFGRA